MMLSDFIKIMLPIVEDEIQDCVQIAHQEGLIELHQMLSYHLGWEGEGAGPKARGKRVRPLLVLLTTEAVEGNWNQALPAAAAVELVHNFTLIHDDIQDDSPLRRGRETVWKKWGIPQAINAGDSMFALAHIALQRLEKLVPSGIALRAHNILPKACLTLTQGQYLDLSFEGLKNISIDEYWPMIKYKTASLIATCTELGALVAGVDDQTQKIYREFGELVGLAYQVQDDLLGIWGDAALTGKSVKSDLLTGKKSLPVIFALEQRKEFAARWEKGSITLDEIPELARMLKDEGAYNFTKEKAEQLTKQAMEKIKEANPQGKAADALLELIEKLICRKV